MEEGNKAGLEEKVDLLMKQVEVLSQALKVISTNPSLSNLGSGVKPGAEAGLTPKSLGTQR